MSNTVSENRGDIVLGVGGCCQQPAKGNVRALCDVTKGPFPKLDLKRTPSEYCDYSLFFGKTKPDIPDGVVSSAVIFLSVGLLLCLI